MLKTNKNRYLILLLLFIAFYVVFLSLLSLIKYHYFQYNGMDLAIFNQSLYLSCENGALFNTIQQNSYFSDHFAPLLYLIKPIYCLFKTPVFLLFLQSFVLGLGAIPVFLIASRSFSKKPNNNVGLFFSILYLINPVILNINLFEFHIIGFAIPLILLSFYFYSKDNFLWFILCCIGALVVREDVSLVIIAYSFIAFFQKKKFYWIIVPFVLSASWFLISTNIVSYLGDGGYKFLIYYDHFGNSFFEIIKNIIIHPIKTLFFTLRIENIVMALSLLMSFMFISLKKPLFLLLSILPFLQIALTTSGGGNLALETHYGSLIISGIIISAIAAYHSIENKKLLHYILIVSGIYSLIMLSAVFPVFNLMFKDKPIESSYINSIPKNASVLSSYKYLPKLSSRDNIYSLNYSMLGVKQFSNETYDIPDIDYAVIDLDDYIAIDLSFKNHPFYNKYYEQNSLNLYNIIQNNNLKPIHFINNTIILSNRINQINLWNLTSFEFNNINNLSFFNKNIALIDYKTEINDKKVKSKLSFIHTNNKNLYRFIIFTFKDSENNIINRQIKSLGYSVFPNTVWPNNKIVTFEYDLIYPNEFNSLFVGLVDIKGSSQLTKTLSSHGVIENILVIGNEIKIK